MDATLATTIRAYLSAIASDHPRPAPGALECVGCHEPLPDGYEIHVLDAIALGVAERPVKPHRVKVTLELAGEDQTVATPATDEDPRPKGRKVTSRVYVGPDHCPDCGRGLISRGSDMICSRLDRATDVKGSGGAVACGVRTDG